MQGIKQSSITKEQSIIFLKNIVRFFQILILFLYLIFLSIFRLEFLFPLSVFIEICFLRNVLKTSNMEV